MSSLRYKEYNDEEARIYEEGIEKMRRCMNQGKTFQEASDLIDVEDDSLKGFILDDALKIFIAEQHFVLGLSLNKISESLRVDLNTIQKAVVEMLEDVAHTSAEYYRMVHGDDAIGNA
ncbi:MAG: hypothetical protein SNJ53_07190 [Thermodesulfovibrionales bacterium]